MVIPGTGFKSGAFNAAFNWPQLAVSNLDGEPRGRSIETAAAQRQVGRRAAQMLPCDHHVPSDQQGLTTDP